MRKNMLKGICTTGLLLCMSVGMMPLQASANVVEKKLRSAAKQEKMIDSTGKNGLVKFGAVKKIKSGGLSESEFKNAPTTKKAFFTKMRANLLKRNTKFSVYYKGKPKDVWLKPLDMLEQVRLLDDKKTSDDGDFLTGSILYISYSVEYTSNRAKFQFAINYTENASQVKSDNTKIKQVLSSLGVSKLSAVGKVKAIHDYVVNHVQYDRTMQDHSAYGGLVASKHTTVCQGYALMMYKMLTEAGVPAHYVTGYAGEAHAWNVVKVGGNWYYLDATWDDPISNKPILAYDYFLVGSTKLNKDHATDATYKKLYKVGASDYNWKAALNNPAQNDDQDTDDDTTDYTDDDYVEDDDISSRNDFIAAQNKELDQELGYSKASEDEKLVYDLYKKIFACVAREMSEDQFALLMSGDGSFYNEYIDICNKKIEDYILTPYMAYLSDDDSTFVDDALKLMLKDYSQKEINKMSEKKLDAIIETYMYKAVMNKMNELSNKYTESIIEECLMELEA